MAARSRPRARALNPFRSRCPPSVTRPSTRTASPARAGRRGDLAPGPRPAAREGLFPTAIDAAGGAAAGRPRPWSKRLRLPAAQVALSTRQLATLVRSGMPLDQALAAVGEQADDAAGAPGSTRRRARRWRRARRSPARWRAGRGRFRSSIAGWSPSRRRRGSCPRSWTRLADYLEARAGAEAAVHAGARLSGAGDRHRVRGHRCSARLRRAADRLRLPAEPADAALAHAGADRSSGLSRGVGVVLARRRGGGERRPSRSRTGARRFARAGTPALLRVPVAGRLVVAVDTARFASTLAILTGSGAPLLRSLDAARDVVWALPIRARRARRRRSSARACRSRGR